jgi:peptidoglycan hydrolase CwlO-like protein
MSPTLEERMARLRSLVGVTNRAVAAALTEDAVSTEEAEMAELDAEQAELNAELDAMQREIEAEREARPRFSIRE